MEIAFSAKITAIKSAAVSPEIGQAFLSWRRRERKRASNLARKSGGYGKFASKRHPPMLALLCHNPTAGLECYTKKDLVAALELRGFEVVYCSTKSKKFPDLLHQPADFIVVAGGDGTVEKVVAKLPDLSKTLGIIPLGSANNIAASYGIAGKPHALAQDWNFERTQPLRIGVARGPWGEQKFIEGLGLGPMARILEDEDMDKLNGPSSILQGRKALRDELKKAKPLTATIEVDGRQLEGEFVAIECINLRFFGPALPILPENDQEDHKLSVIAVRPSDCDVLNEWIEAPHEQRFPLEIVRGRSIQLTWKSAPLHLDDEAMKPSDSLQSSSAELEDSAMLLMPSSRQM
jgi:diacylglycerol kinase (ATP)